MNTRRSLRVTTLLCLLLCAIVAAVELSTLRRFVSTTDRNGDGRPDVWRHFDARGQVTRVDVDSNFDGRPDIHEFYERGTLVRRESDRNFNGQADLIEEFDAETHGQTRSVVDVDFDGTADLLVLFQDGRPVSSRYAAPTHIDSPTQRTVRETDGLRLAALVDPFESDLTVRGVRVAPTIDVCAGVSTSGGLPLSPFALTDRVAPSASLDCAHVSAPGPARFYPRSPRAPPLASVEFFSLL